MSIRYKLFGIPRNVDEFLDREIKNGRRNLRIEIEHLSYLGSGYSDGAVAAYGPQIVSMELRLYLINEKRQKFCCSHLKGEGRYGEMEEMKKKLEEDVTKRGFVIEESRIRFEGLSAIVANSAKKN